MISLSMRFLAQPRETRPTLIMRWVWRWMENGMAAMEPGGATPERAGFQLQTENCPAANLSEVPAGGDERLCQRQRPGELTRHYD